MARRCTWCHEYGHNRRTCSKKKEYIKNNPNSSHAKAWATHDAIIKNSVKRSSQQRSCGYCGDKGHNARTCSQKKADRQTLVDICKKGNYLLATAAYDLGAVYGSLWESFARVRNESGEWEERKIFSIVEKSFYYVL